MKKKIAILMCGIMSVTLFACGGKMILKAVPMCQVQVHHKVKVQHQVPEVPVMEVQHQVLIIQAPVILKVAAVPQEQIFPA